MKKKDTTRQIVQFTLLFVCRATRKFLCVYTFYSKYDDDDDIDDDGMS